MEFALRRLNLSDWKPYKELRHRAFQESSASFSESIEDELDQSSEFFQKYIGDSSEHFTLGAFTNGDQLVGIATFKRDNRSKARHKSYIHTMYVAPEVRGKRIAIKLLEGIIESAKTMAELEQIHLWVLNPEYSIAKKLYHKVGFVAQGATVKKDLKIDGNYIDAEYMTLSLQVATSTSEL